MVNAFSFLNPLRFWGGRAETKSCAQSSTIPTNDATFTLKDEQETEKKRNKSLLLNNRALFLVDGAGGHIFKCMTAAMLVQKNAELMVQLRLALDLEEELYTSQALPLIMRTALLCGSLPASEGVHDAGPGGLFRHSLLVALNAVTSFKSVQSETPKARMSLCILWAALIHDLGKIITDFDISDEHGNSFDPFKQSLEEFMAASESSIMCVRFRAQRSHRHDLCNALRAMLFTGGDMSFFSYLDDTQESSALVNGTHYVWELVAMADGLSVSVSSSRGSSIISVPEFVTDWVLKKLKDKDAANHAAADLFLTPGGILLRSGSGGYRELCKKLQLVYGDEQNGGGVQSLRQGGVARLHGSQRILSWYRVELEDVILLIKGMELKIGVDEELRSHFKEINVIARGNMPPEIRDSIKKSPDLDCFAADPDGKFVPQAASATADEKPDPVYDPNIRAEHGTLAQRTETAVPLSAPMSNTPSATDVIASLNSR